ncbi:hypothetical protein D3C75_918870 [compost metagenome]
MVVVVGHHERTLGGQRHVLQTFPGIPGVGQVLRRGGFANADHQEAVVSGRQLTGQQRADNRTRCARAREHQQVECTRHETFQDRSDVWHGCFGGTATVLTATATYYTAVGIRWHRNAVALAGVDVAGQVGFAGIDVGDPGVSVLRLAQTCGNTECTGAEDGKFWGFSRLNLLHGFTPG